MCQDILLKLEEFSVDGFKEKEKKPHLKINQMRLFS